MTSKPPAFLSPYDVLKTIALLLMLCDHMGAYFFTDQTIWRVFGRLCVPVWLFLIGYARSRRIDAALIGSAIFLVVAHQLVLHQFYALNILFTIMAIRLTIDPIMRYIGTSENRLYGVTFFLFMITPLTRPLMEYGTLAWIFAIWGYLVRHRTTGHAQALSLYGLMALALYMTTEMLMFDFPLWYGALLGAGSLLVYPALTRYLPSGTAIGYGLPVWLRGIAGFMGRHSLFFYVVHLTVILAIIAFRPFF